MEYRGIDTSTAKVALSSDVLSIARFRRAAETNEEAIEWTEEGRPELGNGNGFTF